MSKSLHYCLYYKSLRNVGLFTFAQLFNMELIFRQTWPWFLVKKMKLILLLIFKCLQSTDFIRTLSLMLKSKIKVVLFTKTSAKNLVSLYFYRMFCSTNGKGIADAIIVICLERKGKYCCGSSSKTFCLHILIFLSNPFNLLLDD